MIIMRLLTTCFLVLLSSLSIGQSFPAAKQDELQSVVARRSMAIDETMQLTVRYTGSQQSGQPDFSNLQSQFDILSTSRSNRIHSVNGQVTSYTEWAMILAPQKEGKLIIPSFRYAGLVSDAVEITVTAPEIAPSNIKDIFIETVVDKPSIYVQEQVIVTYRLFYSVAVDALEAQPLELENVVKESLPDQRYSRRIGGRGYNVAEYSYALFPQKSGELVIPALRWDIKVPKTNSNRSLFGFSGRYEIKRQRTDKKVIEVLPPPEAFPSDQPWIPATKLELEESWSKQGNQLAIGEPATRSITMVATGLMASQLPQISQDISNSGLKTYADQPILDDEKSEQGLTATRTESAAVVLNTDQGATLPMIRVPWWDVKNNTLKYAEVPARVIEAKTTSVTTANDGAGTSVPTNLVDGAIDNDAAVQAARSQTLIWQIISALLALALMVIVFVWRFRPREISTQAEPNQKQAREKSAFSALVSACQTDSPADIRVALLTWGQAYWPEDRIATLYDIRKHIDDGEFSEQLNAIDKAIYSQQQDKSLDGRKVADFLTRLRQQPKPSKNENTLQAFYQAH